MISGRADPAVRIMLFSQSRISAPISRISGLRSYVVRRLMSRNPT